MKDGVSRCWVFRAVQRALQCRADRRVRPSSPRAAQPGKGFAVTMECRFRAAFERTSRPADRHDNSMECAAGLAAIESRLIDASDRPSAERSKSRLRVVWPAFSARLARCRRWSRCCSSRMFAAVIQTDGLSWSVSNCTGKIKPRYQPLRKRAERAARRRVVFENFANLRTFGEPGFPGLPRLQR